MITKTNSSLFGLWLIGLLFLTGCQSKPAGLRDYILHKIPAKVLSSYELPQPDSSLVSRIARAPDFMLAYLQAMDAVDNYRPYLPDADETALMISYLEALPATFQSVMAERLLGIYFIENFIGGGMADYVIGDLGQELYVTLILNPAILHTSLSEWVAFRDNSAFETGSYRAGNTLGGSEKGALHTLTHEAAHIYDYVRRATPYTEPSLVELGFSDIEQTDFTAAVWQSYRQVHAEHDFSQRSSITSYGLGKLLPNTALPEVFQALSTTSFASLYGSSNWAEDFAEMAAWLHIRQQYGLEYRIQIYRHDELIAEYSPLDNMRQAKRQELVGDLLSR